MHAGVDVSFLGRAYARDSACYWQADTRTSLDAMFLVIGYRIGWHDHGGDGGFERTYITVRSRADMTGPFVGGTDIIATCCRRARNTAQITYAAERDNRALNK